MITPRAAVAVNQGMVVRGRKEGTFNEGTVRYNFGTIEEREFRKFPCKRHQTKLLVFYPACFASRGSPVRSRSRPPDFKELQGGRKPNKVKETLVLTSSRSGVILGSLNILVDIGVAAEKEVIQ
jgi:hypothetical protein